MPRWQGSGVAADNSAAFTTCNLPSGDGCPSTPWNGSRSLERPGPGVGPLPTLVLIGTRKGGTTGFTTQLLKHPHLLAPDCRTDRASWPRGAASLMCVWDKEVRYFSRGVRQQLDLCWYRGLYPCPTASAAAGAYVARLPRDRRREGGDHGAHAAGADEAARAAAAGRSLLPAYNMGMNEHVQRAGRGRGGFLGRLRNRRELQASAAPSTAAWPAAADAAAGKGRCRAAAPASSLRHLRRPRPLPACARSAPRSPPRCSSTTACTPSTCATSRALREGRLLVRRGLLRRRVGRRPRAAEFAGLTITAG